MLPTSGCVLAALIEEQGVLDMPLESIRIAPELRVGIQAETRPSPTGSINKMHQHLGAPFRAQQGTQRRDDIVKSLLSTSLPRVRPEQLIEPGACRKTIRATEQGFEQP